MAISSLRHYSPRPMRPNRESWGEHSEMIEGWFAEGETLHHRAQWTGELERTPLARAVRWLRGAAN